jgi:hypothetical protein
MIRGILQTTAICAFLAGCGDSDAALSGDRAAAAAPVNAAAAQATSSFQATVNGAVDRTLQGGALSGARYGRYHINMASKGGEGEPIVVIAFGRTDTGTPAPGRYTLGSRGAAFPDGNLEIYSDPQREFDITAGELEITGAADDGLTGRFSFTARERAEEYGTASGEISVEGTFRTQPAN